MADKKISALDPATTPLAGTEVLPIVQSGATVKVSVDNLTAGKAVSALSLTATNIKTSPATANLDISGVTVTAAGSDANISINLTPKGTGVVRANGGANDRVLLSTTTSTTAYAATGLNKGNIQLNAGNGAAAVNGIEFSAGGSNQMFFGTVQEAGGAGSMVIQGYNGSVYRGRFTWSSTGQWNSTSQLTGNYATAGANTANASAILNGQNGTGRINGFQFSSGGNNENFLGVVQEAGGAGALVFQGYNGSVYREYLRVGSSGDLTLPNGNLVIGTAGKGLDFGSSVLWRTGAGSPEGVVTAAVGSLYTRTDGGLLTTLYVKESGAGNTGWVSK